MSPSAAHEVTIELTDEELLARLNGTVAHGDSGGDLDVSQIVERSYGVDLHAAHSPEAMLYDEGEEKPYRFYDPLPNAADEYIEFSQTPFERVYLGVDRFDGSMRGIAPGELCLVVGFAHSSKTVLITEFIMNNRQSRIAFFTPDETRVLVLVKLVSLVHDISAEDLERRIQQGDTAAIEMVRSTARDTFPSLAVFDQTLGIGQMHKALDEVEGVWGGPADAVIFDYADLLDGYDEPKGAISALKAFGKQRHVPMLVLHQSSRTAGKDGQRVTMTSGGYGGEQQATFLIGVRRRKNELLAAKFDLELRIRTSTKDTTTLAQLLADVEHDLRQHENTVTWSLLKSKRPPCTLVDDVDFHLDPRTGRITEMEHGELTHSLANRDTWQQESF